MFSLSVFFEVWGGWGFVYNEKDNNWMMILFSFHPWEDQHSRFLDIDAFPCIWSLNFLKVDVPVLSRCFIQFCFWDFWCENAKIKWGRIGALWQIFTWQQSTTSKPGSAHVYQTAACKTICYTLHAEKYASLLPCREWGERIDATLVFVCSVWKQEPGSSWLS